MNQILRVHCLSASLQLPDGASHLGRLREAISRFFLSACPMQRSQAPRALGYQVIKRWFIITLQVYLPFIEKTSISIVFRLRLSVS
jgi:hypothetical protein